MSASQETEANLWKELLIAEIEKRPSIWDKDATCYHDQVVKTNDWMAVAEECSKTASECKKAWKNIRDSYIKFKQSGKGASGAAAHKRYSYVFAEQLRFLDSGTVSRSSRTSSIERPLTTSTLTESDGGFDDASSPPDSRPVSAVSDAAVAETLHSPNPKKKIKSTACDLQEALCASLANTDKLLSSALCSPVKAKDEDDAFGEYIGLELKRLAIPQKDYFKLEVQQALYRAKQSQMPAQQVLTGINYANPNAPSTSEYTDPNGW